MVLVHMADVNENQHTRGTCLKGMCSLIHLLLYLTKTMNRTSCSPTLGDLALPEHLRHSQLVPNKLAYVEWFTPFRAPHPDSGLFPVSRASRNNGPVSEIILLNSNVSSCYLIPRFGTKYLPAKWESDTVLEECKSFFLNKYLYIQTFLDLEQHLNV